jgi:cell division septation protein DedD
MSRSYYVIELSARWLTVLLVALALLMVAAFSLGYGAAWSVKAGGPGAEAGGSPTPVVMTEVILDPTVPQPQPSPTLPAATATAQPMPPTVVPPTRAPATATPEAKPTVKPRPTEEPAEGFWVQVMASSKEDTIGEARTKLVGLGFDLDHQQIVHSEVAGGNELVKLRVGPLPDRASADRVMQRMRGAGFPDAWVVVP